MTLTESGGVSPQETPDCGLRIADCGLRIADCGLRIADRGSRIADCGLQNDSTHIIRKLATTILNCRKVRKSFDNFSFRIVILRKDGQFRAGCDCMYGRGRPVCLPLLDFRGIAGADTQVCPYTDLQPI